MVNPPGPTVESRLGALIWMPVFGLGLCLFPPLMVWIAFRVAETTDGGCRCARRILATGSG